MGRSDRLRVAAAQVNGIAAAYAQVRRVDHDGALDEIRAVLAKLDAAQHQGVLDQAAVMYVVAGDDSPWYPAALQLLIDAGADRGEAERIRAARQGGDWRV